MIYSILECDLPVCPLLQASQKLTMARYATATATEIRPQLDSNPVLTSTVPLDSRQFGLEHKHVLLVIAVFWLSVFCGIVYVGNFVQL